MTHAPDPTLHPLSDHLSDYVDGDLAPDERTRVEAHLAMCAGCRRVRDDLVRVVSRARATRYGDPRQDLWPRVEAGIARTPPLAREDAHSDRSPATLPATRSPARPARSRRVITLTLGRLAAAAAIVAVIAGGLAWGIATDRARSAAMASTPDSAIDATTVTATSAPDGAASLALASYRDAASDMERALQARRGSLRPETMRVIEENLRRIDVAIAQADSALKADPGSAYLNQYLAETMQRKLKLLRRAVAIASAES